VFETLHSIGFISSVISVVSLAVSVTVLVLTQRRGVLKMTNPVQIAFTYKSENVTNAKISLRALLYATGKRGYVIEGLFLKVKQPDSMQTFGVWAYGEQALTVASGLRVPEEGVAHQHHFLKIADYSYFVEGEYQIDVYARLVNGKTKCLTTIKLALTEGEATRLHLQHGALFTWNPDAQNYNASFEDRKSANE
jgi:hypothetical protein